MNSIPSQNKFFSFRSFSCLYTRNPKVIVLTRNNTESNDIIIIEIWLNELLLLFFVVSNVVSNVASNVVSNVGEFDSEFVGIFVIVVGEFDGANVADVANVGIFVIVVGEFVSVGICVGICVGIFVGYIVGYIVGEFVANETLLHKNKIKNKKWKKFIVWY